MEASLAYTSIELPNRGLCAHRGAMRTHPENTLAAFREATRCGAQMIEFDVHRTKDDALVVMHDPTVDRTTDGTGHIAALTFAEIRQLDAGSWKSPQFTGTRVPTLEETLAVMPVNIWLNIHLKGGDILGARVAEVIAQRDRLHQAVLACGAAAAKGARSVTPGILICNMERQGASWTYVEDTLAMYADFVQFSGPITPEYASYVKVLNKHGVRSNYFGTDDPEELRTLFAYGVDFPLVNDIANAIKVAVELGIEPVQPIFRTTH